MDKMKLSLMAVALAALAFSGRSLLSEEHEGHGAAGGPNCGEVQEVGDKDDIHVELVHDHANGKVTLYLLAKDKKTPVSIRQAPKVNLKAKDGNRQVVMKPVDPVEGAASRWDASDEGFKADPLDGRISIALGGKKYQVKLDAHPHDDHEGHDHGK